MTQQRQMLRTTCNSLGRWLYCFAAVWSHGHWSHENR